MHVASAGRHDLLQHALLYASIGWWVFPLHHLVVAQDKLTCSCAAGALCEKGSGKHPLTEKGFLEASIDPDCIRRWWQRWPRANIGIVTGTRSSIFVLDFDGKSGGLVSRASLAEQRGLPRTIQAKTGNGLHDLYQYPQHIDVRSGTNIFKNVMDGMPGVDIRGNGGYIVAPPSLHLNGQYYDWIVPPNLSMLAPAPDWLLAILSDKAKRNDKVILHAVPSTVYSHETKLKRCQAYVDSIGGVPKGERHNYALKTMCPIGLDFDLEPEEFWPILVQWNNRCMPDGLPEDELRQCLHDSPKYRSYPRGFRLEQESNGHREFRERREQEERKRTPLREAVFVPPGDAKIDNPPEWEDSIDAIVRHVEAREAPYVASTDAGGGQGGRPALKDLYSTNTGPDGFPKTEMGNAERIARDHGPEIRHVPQSGQWYLWSGTHWKVDDALDIPGLVLHTARGMSRGELDAQNEDERKAWRSWCKHSEGKRNIDNSLALSGLLDGIKLESSRFDADDFVINTPSGVFDVRTLELTPHAKDQYMSRVTRAPYDPGARCPQWHEFLKTIFDGDDEMIAFIQRAVGYSLTGSCREQCLFFLYGFGANGKSTALNVIRAISANYASHTPFDTFMEQDSDKVRNDIARLQGVRFVSTTEPRAGKRMDEALIKQLTGQDPVTARFLRKEFFEYIPKFKIWISANHKPRIRGTDDGIWRRIRLIPFKIQIPPERQDPDLPVKLEAEFAGIMAWALHGAHLWLVNGMRTPQSVIDATKEYRAENDGVGLFIDAECVVMTHVPSPPQTSSATLYSAYCDWIKDLNERPMSAKAFSQILQAKGFELVRTKAYNAFRGIGLSSKASPSN